VVAALRGARFANRVRGPLVPLHAMFAAASAASVRLTSSVPLVFSEGTRHAVSVFD